MSSAIARMRCCRSSAWTRISPICSLIGPRSLGALAPVEPDALAGLRTDTEALARGHARDPGDLAVRHHDGERGPAGARDLAVGEQVLQRAAPVHPERPHP